MLVNCGATSDFMSMQTAERGRLLIYIFTHQRHVMTAGGVQVEVRYYTRGDVLVGELELQNHFKVLEILPDVGLGFPGLQSYGPTVKRRERYADVRHGVLWYPSSFDGSRDSTQLQFQATLNIFIQ